MRGAAPTVLPYILFGVC